MWACMDSDFFVLQGKVSAQQDPNTCNAFRIKASSIRLGRDGKGPKMTMDPSSEVSLKYISKEKASSLLHLCSHLPAPRGQGQIWPRD